MYRARSCCSGCRHCPALRNLSQDAGHLPATDASAPGHRISRRVLLVSASAQAHASRLPCKLQKKISFFRHLSDRKSFCRSVSESHDMMQRPGSCNTIVVGNSLCK